MKKGKSKWVLVHNTPLIGRRIFNKYLLIEILSYSYFHIEAMNLMYKLSKRIRVLLLKNYKAISKICIIE